MNMWIVVVFFVTLILILSSWLSVVLWSLKNGISPMPTSIKAMDKIIHSIPKETQGVIVDLGSGWGTMVFKLAKAFPHCQVVGYETSPMPYFLSYLWKSMQKLPNLDLRRKNFFYEDLRQATLIYCYLHPAAMESLKDKFNEELRPGTIVISNTFAIPDWSPVQVIQLQDIYRTRIYLYVKSPNSMEKIYLRAEAELEAHMV